MRPRDVVVVVVVVDVVVDVVAVVNLAELFVG